jgi:hypothetical protein
MLLAGLVSVSVASAEPLFLPVGAGVSSTSKQAILSGAKNVLTCKKSKQSGAEITNPHLIGRIVIHFEECKNSFEGGTPCAAMSGGAGVAEEIVTNTLHAVLGLALLPGKPSVAAVLFLPESGAKFVSILGTCVKPSPTAVNGNVVASILPVGVHTEHGQLFLGETGGVQNLRHFLPSLGGLVNARLEAFGVAEATEEVEEANITFSTPTEVTIT